MDQADATHHLGTAALTAGLAGILAAPQDHGILELIVCRPRVDQRDVLDRAELNHEVGLVGDSWGARGSSSTASGGAHPDKQLTIMNARVAQLVAQDRGRWALAGDQLYIDLDLSQENLPAGTRLTVGGAVVEVTEPPHLGCAKFSERFGLDAWRFVNSDVGKQHRLRGLNAKVVQGGPVATGDIVTKV